MVWKLRLKQKSRHASRRDSCGGGKSLGGGFCHRLDALGAEQFMHLAPLFEHQRLLQVRFERAVGGALGEGAVVPKGCGFSTVCAFSHCDNFLSCYNSSTMPSVKARHFIT